MDPKSSFSGNSEGYDPNRDLDSFTDRVRNPKLVHRDETSIADGRDDDRFQSYESDVDERPYEDDFAIDLSKLTIGNSRVSTPHRAEVNEIKSNERQETSPTTDMLQARVKSKEVTLSTGDEILHTTSMADHMSPLSSKRPSGIPSDSKVPDLKYNTSPLKNSMLRTRDGIELIGMSPYKTDLSIDLQQNLSKRDRADSYHGNEIRHGTPESHQLPIKGTEPTLVRSVTHEVPKSSIPISLPSKLRADPTNDPTAALKMKPPIRKTLFATTSKNGGVSSPFEVENLQKQLSNYKMKTAALYEIIKEANLGSGKVNTEWSGEYNTQRNSFYERLLNTIKQDDELNELREQNSRLNSRLEEEIQQNDSLRINVEKQDKEIEELKMEYSTTLKYAEEYIKHSESMSEIIDSIINFIVEIDFQNVKLPENEIQALIKAKEIGSNFIMVKLNALDLSLKNFLNALQKEESHLISEIGASEKENVIANSTQIDSTPIRVPNESQLDTKMEIAIEDLHKEYDNFIKSIRSKLREAAELENDLLLKLSKQDRLISMISKKSQEDSNNDITSIEKNSTIASNFKDINQQVSIDISRSYQEHVDSLNNLVSTLKINITEKDSVIETLKERLKGMEENASNIINTSEYNRLAKEVVGLKELAQAKEKNWDNLTMELESEIKELTKSNIRLQDVVEELSDDLEKAEDSNKQIIKEFKSSNDRLKDYDVELKDLRARNENLAILVRKQKTQDIVTSQTIFEFKKFEQSLVFHLSNIFQTLQKIIQKHSIDQSMKKISTIRELNGLENLKAVQPRFDALYTFIETALDSIISSYTSLVTQESKEGMTNLSSNENRDLKLRIEELQRRWLAERERRKFDVEAAEQRISKLEMENELLKEQLFNSSVRN